jgi:hypothetical protein
VTAKPPSLPDAPRRRFRIERVILMILALSLAALLVWHISFRIRTNNAIKRLEAKARANGEPLTLKELAASYAPIPDEENAAIPLMDLWEKEDPAFWAAYRANRRPFPLSSRINPYELPVMTTGWNRASAARPLDAKSLAVAEKFLMDHSEHAALLHDALKRRKARFLVRFEEGPDSLIPHKDRLRFEEWFLRLESLVLMAKGDTNGAVQAVVDCYALGELLKEEPLIISQIFRVASREIADRSVEDLLNQAALSPAQIAALETANRRTADPRLVRTALLGERVLSVDILSSLPILAALMAQADSCGDPDWKETLVIRFSQMSGLAQADHLCLLDVFDKAITAAALDLPEGLKAYEAAFAELETGRRPGLSTLVSRMLLPALSKSLARQATADAHHRCAETALAIERFRLSNGGRLPDTLDALTPTFLAEILNDPFDGKPLRYHQKNPGYVIYSIGSDLADDHGLTREDASAARLRLPGYPQASGDLQFDETFTVER